MGEILISASALAEVVPNCCVGFYDTRSESSGIFYYPIPAGGVGGGEQGLVIQQNHLVCNY